MGLRFSLLEMEASLIAFGENEALHRELECLLGEDESHNASERVIESSLWHFLAQRVYFIGENSKNLHLGNFGGRKQS